MEHLDREESGKRTPKNSKHVNQTSKISQVSEQVVAFTLIKPLFIVCTHEDFKVAFILGFDVIREPLLVINPRCLLKE